MKKYKKPIIVGLIVLLAFLGIRWICWHFWFYYDNAQAGNMYLRVNYKLHVGYVEGVHLQSREAQEIVIPDEFRGARITGLGGSAGIPGPFNVSLERAVNSPPKGGEYHSTYRLDELEQKGWTDRIVEVPVTVYLGKYVKEVDGRSFADECYTHVNEDGSVVFCYPKLYFVCSEDNRYFYSRDGILYYQNGRIVQQLCP